MMMPKEIPDPPTNCEGPVPPVVCPGDEATQWAKFALRPTVQGALTLQQYGGEAFDLKLDQLVDALTEQTKAATAGRHDRGEAMLAVQAHTLDAIFNTMARRALSNAGEYLNAADVYLKLALRAQAQCRATWETLAMMRNPPLVQYAKQANITHGPQQVNNAPSGVGEIQIGQNKVLEQTDGERLDTGATGPAGKVDTRLGTRRAAGCPT